MKIWSSCPSKGGQASQWSDAVETQGCGARGGALQKRQIHFRRGKGGSCQATQSQTGGIMRVWISEKGDSWAGQTEKDNWIQWFWDLGLSHFSTMFRALRTRKTDNAFPCLTLRLEEIWGTWSTSTPVKCLQEAAITQCRYHPASPEKNSEKSRWGGSQSSLNLWIVPKQNWDWKKEYSCEKRVRGYFCKPSGWSELQAAVLFIVCSCFVSKSENCNNISGSQRRFRSREKIVWMVHPKTSISEDLHSLSLSFNQWRLLM